MELSNIPEIIKYDTIQITDKYPAHIVNVAKKIKNLKIISIIYKSGKLKIHGFIFKKRNIDNY